MSEPGVDENAKTDLPADTSVNKESEATTTTTTTTAELQNEDSNKPSEPPAKKKRGAERQMTKDDCDEGEGDEQEIKHGFQRASAEVLAKRKIFKVKRPSAAAVAATASSSTTSSNAFGGFQIGAAAVKTGDEKKEETKEAESKPANPFGAAKLVSQEKKDDTASAPVAAATEKPPVKKVFGSGSAFSGFKTAVSSTGFGSSSGFGGFGSAARTNADQKPSGFGITAASLSGGFGTNATAPGGLFGNASASSGQTATTGNLFQTAAAGAGSASKLAFGFGNKAESNETNDGVGDDEKDTVDATIPSGPPAVILPEHVDTPNGEEDEKLIHEGRCKCFHWVPDVPAPENTDAETIGPKVANPSVKPSSEFEAAISSASKEEKKDSETADKDKELAKEDGDKEAKEEENTDGDNVSSTAPTSQAQQFRWQELGVGPMKILRSISNPEKYRVVQRRESTKNGPATKVILNVPLWKESTSERAAPKFLTVKTLVDGEVASYSLKFKDSSDASYFHHYLTEAIPNAKSAFGEGE
jgi:hypothetical protein